MHKIIITLLFSVIAFTAQADHENIYGLAPMGLPAQCGPSEIINQYVHYILFYYIVKPKLSGVSLIRH